MANLLCNQQSPYLLEHAHQPVEWMPWGRDALELAKSADKPLLLSIGYASCHWCCRMSEENFEDSYVASIMNRHFICIKIDREERPDLDQTYMEAVRMFNQSAGWPLHIFCMPDGSPFWGGTFFPKEDNGQGIAPWPQVLMRIAEHYRKARHELQENADHARANLEHSNHANLANPDDWHPLLLLQAASKLCSAHDDTDGGFTPAPKFPSPMKIDFLLAVSEAQSVRQNPQLSSRIEECVSQTLTNLATRAIQDPLGGGFFRYALDAEWNSPHFEKMLSDNALLISTFAKAHRKFKNPLYEKIVRQTLQWTEDALCEEDVGFACSLSAEINGVEGAHYLWNMDELTEVLGTERGKTYAKKLSPIGSSKEDAYLPRSIPLDQDWDAETDQQTLRMLAEKRSQRTAPSADRKCLLTDHALLARALIDAGVSFSSRDWIGRAHTLLLWMEGTYARQGQTVSSVRFPDGSLSQHGFLEDYAFWTEAQLAFAAIAEPFGYEPAEEWIARAEGMANFIRSKFKDERVAGYFATSADQSSPPPVRKKFWFDNALPSGNSSLLRIFHTLRLIGKKRDTWAQEYTEALGGYVKIAQNTPEGIGHALAAISEGQVGVVTITGEVPFLQLCTQKLAKYPHRPVYFFAADQKKMTVNGQDAEPPTDPADWIHYLYG